ncbi:MFS transporter [Truepera radiovictrix]|nr:MFS transporter [Truepera radiovictrix]WMT58744.1 MFS transporter [Truepera radiovictrix]
MSWQRTLYIMVFAQLTSSVGFSIMFPFLPRYVAFLGSSTGLSLELLAALVFSAQALTMTIASPIWGAVSDRVGRKPMVERAAYSGAVTLALMAFVPNAEALVLLRALQGFLTGTVSAGNALVAASAPRERVGYAMGLLQLGLGSGVAIGPFIGGLLSDAFGYRTAFLVTAALLALSGLLVTFGVRETFVRPPKKARSGVLRGWGRILRAPQVGTLYSLSFLNWLGRNMLTPILPLFIATLPLAAGGANTTIGLIVGVAAATGTVSAIYLGRLGDRLGHRWILILCASAAALLYLPQSLVTQVWQLLVLQALTGVAVGGMTPAIAALLARYTEPGAEGVVYGLDNAIVSASRTVAPLLGAAVVELVRVGGPRLGWGLSFDDAYRSIFVVTSGFFLLAALLALVRLPLAKPQQPVRARE